ncbi:hypothetical protein [Micromonospora sp. NPDC007230]|uniref:hypothetical protein n=1 Tax=Micromonospora sp. NPDC007230 TaxID=3364237 RepID=UPI0036AD3A82
MRTERTAMPAPDTTIVVGYTPTPAGEAAVRAAVEEARLQGGSLYVVNVSRGDAYVDRNLASRQHLNNSNGCSPSRASSIGWYRRWAGENPQRSCCVS